MIPRAYFEGMLMNQKKSSGFIAVKDSGATLTKVGQGIERRAFS